MNRTNCYRLLILVPGVDCEEACRSIIHVCQIVQVQICSVSWLKEASCTESAYAFHVCYPGLVTREGLYTGVFLKGWRPNLSVILEYRNRQFQGIHFIYMLL